MAMFEFGIGGNEVKLDASEAIFNIDHNKTLLAQKLTTIDPLKPEVVNGLKTVEEVFGHFKPQATVEFDTVNNGGLKAENFRFNNLGDFGVKRIVEQSDYLTNLDLEVEHYNRIAKQFKTNKVLKAIVENPERKQALAGALTALLNELNAEK